MSWRFRRDSAVKIGFASAVALAQLLSTAASASTISGTFQGQEWTATNDIVGQTSTGTTVFTPPQQPGNPIYWGHSPAPGYDNSKYSGVVALILNEGAAGNFICSGSLLADRIHVLTAGHCVSNGHSNIVPLSATVAFYNGTDPQAVIGTTGAPSPGVVRVNVSAFSVDRRYTGEVIDDHDIAIVTLAQAAPLFATGYKIYTDTDLVGADYNIAGYGARSSQGGTVGADLGTGRLRQGDNRYDFTLGDAAFGGFFDAPRASRGTPKYFGTAEVDHSYLSDFDNGLTTQDASCRFAVSGFGATPSTQFCNLGRGATEVSSAGGDSGGPQFINGQVASVTSYGLSFGPTFGDIDGSLNSSFGEFNGFVSTAYNIDYIGSVANIPEPASWAMMIAGFGLVGVVARRRREDAVAA